MQVNKDDILSYFPPLFLTFRFSNSYFQKNNLKTSNVSDDLYMNKVEKEQILIVPDFLAKLKQKDDLTLKIIAKHLNKIPRGVVTVF